MIEKLDIPVHQYANSTIHQIIGKLNEIIETINRINLSDIQICKEKDCLKFFKIPLSCENHSRIIEENGKTRKVEVGKYYSAKSGHRVYIFDRTRIENESPYPDGWYYDGIILGQKGFFAKGLWDKDGHPMLLIHSRRDPEERRGVYLDLTSCEE